MAERAAGAGGLPQYLQIRQGMLASMSLEILQEILAQLPLCSRLQPAFAAKFMWLAATSTDGRNHDMSSSPLGALLPPTALGSGRWEIAPTGVQLSGHFVFPPAQSSKTRNHWLLTGAGGDFSVVPTPKGNAKTMSRLALAGGGHVCP